MISTNKSNYQNIDYLERRDKKSHELLHGSYVFKIVQAREGVYKPTERYVSVKLERAETKDDLPDPLLCSVWTTTDSGIARPITSTRLMTILADLAEWLEEQSASAIPIAADTLSTLNPLAKEASDKTKLPDDKKGKKDNIVILPFAAALASELRKELHFALCLQDELNGRNQ